MGASQRSALKPFLVSSLVALGAFLVVGALVRGPLAEPAEPAAAGAADYDQPLALTEGPEGAIDADDIVVDFKDGTPQEEMDALDAVYGVDFSFNSVEGADDGIAVAHVDAAGRDALLEKLRNDPHVESAEPLMRFKASFVPNDPDYKKQWHMEMIGMKDAWEKSTGEGVVVAVIDTGVAYEDNGEFKAVPDLKGAKFVAGYDFVNDDEHANDDHGHGTHVAGTIAQRTNNGVGVAGVAYKASIMPLKVLDANGMGTSADIADAIRWAADHGAKVMNLSLGGGGRSEAMASAVAYARKKGSLVVCAAGNGGRPVVEYPAAYPGATAVSAVGPSGELAFYSSYGKQVAIAAPGGDKSKRQEDGVLQNTIAPGRPDQNVYAYYQGTSMATPHVAGVAALLFAAGAKTPDEVEKALFDGATKKGDGVSEKYGHGILNAKGSLEALKGKKPGNPTPWPVPKLPQWDWKSVLMFLWGILVWLVTRITNPAAERGWFKPGLGFFFGLLVSTVGAVFLGWLGISETLAQPVAEWGDALTAGRANPIFFSAIIPFVLAMIGFTRKGWRGLLAGYALGTGAYLLWRLFTGTPAMAWMPFDWMAGPWVFVNALAALLLGRALMRRAGLAEARVKP